MFFPSLNVRVVSSAGPGEGKSLVVQRLAEQVENLPNNLLVIEAMKAQDQEPPELCVTIPFHDRNACVSDAVGFFLPHAVQSDVPLSRIFHLDSSCTVRITFEVQVIRLLVVVTGLLNYCLPDDYLASNDLNYKSRVHLKKHVQTYSRADWVSCNSILITR